MYLKGHQKGDWIDGCKQSSKVFLLNVSLHHLLQFCHQKNLSAAHLSFFFLSQFLRFQRHNYKVISTPWDSTMKNWKACIDDSMTNGVLGIFPHIIFIDLICKVKSIIKTNDDRGKICSRGLLRLSDVTIVTWIFFKTFFMVLSSNLRLFGKFYNFIFMSIFTQISSTVFENHRKGLIQHCEWTKVDFGKF